MSRILLVSTALALMLLAFGLGGTPGPGADKESGCRKGPASESNGEVRLHEPPDFVPVACLRLHRTTTDGADGSSFFRSARDLQGRTGWEVGERRYLRLRGGEEEGTGATGARALFPRGWKGGSAPVWAERDITHGEHTRLYLSFRLKLSHNWQGHPVNDKLLYVWTHGKPVVFPVYVGGDDSPLTTEVRLQDIPGGARNLSPNRGSTSIERGQWHRWEILLVAGGAGVPDGEIQWWIDGRKVGEYDDIRFGARGQERVWERVSWRPVWGGAGGVVREDQYMWIDDLYVSGGP